MTPAVAANEKDNLEYDDDDRVKGRSSAWFPARERARERDRACEGEPGMHGDQGQMVKVRKSIRNPCVSKSTMRAAGSSSRGKP